MSTTIDKSLDVLISEARVNLARLNLQQFASDPTAMRIPDGEDPKEFCARHLGLNTPKRGLVQALAWQGYSEQQILGFFDANKEQLGRDFRLAILTLGFDYAPGCNLVLDGDEPAMHYPIRVRASGLKTAKVLNLEFSVTKQGEEFVIAISSPSEELRVDFKCGPKVKDQKVVDELLETIKSTQGSWKQIDVEEGSVNERRAYKAWDYFFAARKKILNAKKPKKSQKAEVEDSTPPAESPTKAAKSAK